MAINTWVDSQGWAYYGYYDWWWKRAIEMYVHLTGNEPVRSDKGSFTPAIYWLDGRVALHRLSYCLRAEEGNHASYLRQVLKFWDEHSSLSSLMLPTEKEHATT